VGKPERTADHHHHGNQRATAVDRGVGFEKLNDLKTDEDGDGAEAGHCRRQSNTDARHFLEEAVVYQHAVSDHVRQVGDQQHDQNRRRLGRHRRCVAE
jgi:hypothetical protein